VRGTLQWKREPAARAVRGAATQLAAAGSDARRPGAGLCAAGDGRAGPAPRLRGEGSCDARPKAALGKVVVAATDDEVAFGEGGLAVNGCAVAASRPQARDTAGRRWRTLRSAASASRRERCGCSLHTILGRATAATSGRSGGGGGARLDDPALDAYRGMSRVASHLPLAP